MKLSSKKHIIALMILSASILPAVGYAQPTNDYKNSSGVYRNVEKGENKESTLYKANEQYQQEKERYDEKQIEILTNKLLQEISKKYNFDLNNSTDIDKQIIVNIENIINLHLDKINEYTNAISKGNSNDYTFFFRGMEYDGIYDILQYAKSIKINMPNKYDSKKFLQKAMDDYTKDIDLYPQSEMSYVRRGDCFYKAGEYAKAICDYFEAIFRNPNNPASYAGKAKANAALGAYQIALTDYTKAINKSKEYWEKSMYYRERADVYDKLNQDINSFNDDVVALKYLNIGLNKASELNELSVNEYSNLASRYREEKKYTKAIMACTKAIEFEPQNTHLYKDRAETYMKMSRLDDAIKDCDKIIELEPEKLNHYEYKGILYSKAGQHRKAIEVYSAIISEHPDDVQGYLDRAEAYTFAKDYENALKDQDKILEFITNNPELYVQHAFSNIQLGNYREAIADIDKAISLDNNDDFFYSTRSLLNTLLKQGEDALSDANKAINISADNGYNYITRGHAYYSLEDYEKAIADYTKAITLKPDYSYNYYSRGCSYHALKKYDKALADYNKCLSIEPKDISAYYARADVYITLGKIDDALKDVEYMLKFEPDNPMPYLSKARIYSIQGRHEEAMADYNKAVELSEKHIKEDKLQYSMIQARAYYMLGLEKLSVYKDREAMECFKKAVDLNGLNKEIIEAITFVKEDLDKSEERINGLNKAIAYLKTESSNPANKEKLLEMTAQIEQLEKLRKQIQDDFYANAPRPNQMIQSARAIFINYQEQDFNKAPIDISPSPIKIKPPSI